MKCKITSNVKFEDGKLSLMTERGAFATKIKVNGTAVITYGFDCDFMLEALNHLKKEAKSITVKVCGPAMSITMTDNKADLVLVLPVRMKEDAQRKAA